MKRGRILNKDLNEVIASMGHGDLLIVCDAGFPIPPNVRRVDLALEKDYPDLLHVLSLIKEDFIAERVAVAAEMEEFNPKLFKAVKELFAEAKLETIPHEKVLSEMPCKAKAIVRTGAFNPWGNILLFSGVDVPQWFNKEGVKVPPYYQDRMK
ncbi:D-ribose pyranase [Neomoorella thermoacetica]|uniref:D-ribose pyranase n=1 Tax=Neomoorella thermoacetica TaxID=1525 RepID=UPI0008FB743C|nr:D-ribose pyranase [Moorella thermoacetica]APC09280.1 D-ribose pyranase [Moorella thermoacetica]